MFYIILLNFSAWIPHEQVYAYIGNKEKFLLRSRVPKGFKEALEAIEDAIKEMPEEVWRSLSDTKLASVRT